MSFDDFWSHYPLKKGKGYARKCYEKARKNGMPPDSILFKAIDEQRRERLFLKSQNRFVPEWKNPSTWINQECWGDVCQTSVKKRVPKRQESSLVKMRRAYDALVYGGEINSIAHRLHLTNYEKECVIMSYNGGPAKVQRLAGRIGGV